MYQQTRQRRLEGSIPQDFFNLAFKCLMLCLFHLNLTTIFIYFFTLVLLYFIACLQPLILLRAFVCIELCILSCISCMKDALQIKFVVIIKNRGNLGI